MSFNNTEPDFTALFLLALLNKNCRRFFRRFRIVYFTQTGGIALAFGAVIGFFGPGRFMRATRCFFSIGLFIASFSRLAAGLRLCIAAPAWQQKPRCLNKQDRNTNP